VALILVYHRIAEPIVDPWGLCVSPALFAEQSACLRIIADPVPLDTIALARSDKELPDRPVAVTFDDGYAETLTNAAPILESFALPATVFVTTGYLDLKGDVWSDELASLVLLARADPETLMRRCGIESNAGFPVRGTRSGWYAWEPATELRQWLYCTLYDRLLGITSPQRSELLGEVRAWAGAPLPECDSARMLSSAECAQLASVPQIEIGAHTVSHPVLSRLDAEHQKLEVANSKRALESLLRKPVRAFAYPYGKRDHFNSESVAAVQAAGFECACANYGRPTETSTSRWALPRYQILNWPGNRFADEITQWFRE
jgi:peptidoglycan/xylan/chitin deacetylase (PgdA/CDA1 family)